jgi:geranylgeranyl pyrophosphate synthase
MKREVEKELRNLFPPRWTKTKIEYFIKATKHKIDINALNQNLNTPTIDFLFRGGKRLRPTLFLLSLKLFGKKPQKYLDIAAAIELTHNAPLVLDDIEDGATLRRGKPASHLKYGLDTATNTGMAMHILPLRVLLSNHPEISPLQRLKLINIFANELINVSFGQALDIHWHKNPKTQKITPPNYLEMVRLKTGCLMRMSTLMACAIAQRNTQTHNLFSSFAESLGTSFQIIDDSLDLSRPDDKFGKAFGNDITEGKISLPVVFTITSASQKDKKRLLDILSMHTRNKRYIKEAIHIIEKSNSIEKSTDLARKILTQSWNSLQSKWKNRGDLSELEKMVQFLLDRKY